MTGSESAAYDQGRSGGAAPTHVFGNQKDAYELGAKHRRDASAGGGGGGGGGGGMGLVALILAGIVLAIVVPAALASFLSAALMLVVLGTLGMGKELRYWQAYKACFVATAVFVGLAAGVYFGAEQMVRDYGPQTLFTHLVRAVVRIGHGLFAGLIDPADGLRRLAQFHAALSQAHPAANSIVAMACAVLFGPAVLGGALALHALEEWPATGLVGYAAAIVATLAVLLPGLAISLWVLVQLGQHVQPASVKALKAPLENMAIAGALLTLAYVVVVPIIVGIAMRLLGLAWAPLADPELRTRLAGTSVLVALVYGIGMALAMLMFRRGDSLVQWADAWLAGGAAVGALLWTALAATWPLAVPAVLAAGAVVAARHERPFSGVAGYAAACALGGAAATLLWWPVPVAGVMAYRAGLLAP